MLKVCELWEDHPGDSPKGGSLSFWRYYPTGGAYWPIDTTPYHTPPHPATCQPL